MVVIDNIDITINDGRFFCVAAIPSQFSPTLTNITKMLTNCYVVVSCVHLIYYMYFVCSGDYEEALLTAGTLEQLDSILVQLAKEHPNNFEVMLTTSRAR